MISQNRDFIVKRRLIVNGVKSYRLREDSKHNRQMFRLRCALATSQSLLENANEIIFVPHLYLCLFFLDKCEIITNAVRLLLMISSATP